MTTPQARALMLCWALWLRWRAAGGRWEGRQIDPHHCDALMAHIRSEHVTDDEA